MPSTNAAAYSNGIEIYQDELGCPTPLSCTKSSNAAIRSIESAPTIRPDALAKRRDVRSELTSDCDSGVYEDDDVVTRNKFYGKFTHEDGGTLQKAGSDVILSIPPGAVPPGKTYHVEGEIHRHLHDYNSWMEDREDYILIGPVSEYNIKGGGNFEKHVEITTPHCVGKNWQHVCVMYGTGEDFKDISNSDDEMSYTVDDSFVHIWTKHFTKFLVAGKVQEITDALLTVAASKKDVNGKNIIELRLMLHMNCAVQNDFTDFRIQFYDQDMEEIKAQKVTLPHREEPMDFPAIQLQVTVGNDCSWEVDSIDSGRVSAKSSTVMIDGRNVLAMPDSGPSHRSEHLSNFHLENKHTTEQLDCIVQVSFDYGENFITHKMHIVYPICEGVSVSSRPRASSKTLLEPSDALRSVFLEIANRIAGDFEKIAIKLGLSQQAITELKRAHEDMYAQNYSLLMMWRQANGATATLETLVEILGECDRKDLVDEAENIYHQSSSLM